MHKFRKKVIIINQLPSTKMSNTTVKQITTTSTTTTERYIINDDQSDGFETVEGFLLIIVLELMLMITYKLFKLYKRGYNVHNERIIQRHQNQVQL